MKKLRGIICFFLGHRSVMTYITYYYDPHMNYRYADTIQYKCERCGEEK